MKGKIAVVIPVFNREELVIRALESAFSQTVSPAEIIVVDNNSTDGSRTAVERWMSERSLPGVRMLLISEPTPGACAARNAGLKEVTTEYVHFLDSDDCMLPELVARATEAIRETDSPDLVCWWAAYATPSGLNKKRVSHNDMFKGQIYQSRLSTQTFAVRTDFLRRAGGWNSSLPGWNDWELGIRLLSRKPRIAFVDEILVAIDPQRVSITGENYHSKAGQWELAIDAAESVVTGLPEEKRLKGMINYRRVNLAALYKQEGREDLATPLLKRALEHPAVSPFQRFFLKLIYQYTSRGGRGGYLFYDLIGN